MDAQDIPGSRRQNPPAFNQGLLHLLVADDRQDCGEGRLDQDEFLIYPDAHVVYLDTAGRVVLEESAERVDAAAPDTEQKHTSQDLDIPDHVDECQSQGCFSQRLAQCEPARYRTSAILEARAAYTIIGPEDDACRVALVFSDNPNPDWVDAPLAFLIDPKRDADAELKSAVEACLTGNLTEHVDC